MITVNFQSQGLRHTINGDALTVINYLLDEARYTDALDIVSIHFHLNDSPEEQ